MTSRLLLLASTALVAACTQPAAQVASAPAPVAAAPAALVVEPAPLASLVQEVDLKHQSFTMANGLKVLVHEDHKAPVVGFGVWYNVGSKDEPKGKTGFAHLFEHLMFYGSDNVREGVMPYLQNIGATDWNGTTWFDRTNYFETVPKANLEKVLFMESDRMGYLLPAIDQKRLDLQRGVVQNEKREGDNQPKGLVDYDVLATLFPEGHPYHHDTIGSMADLDSASVADVKQWFLDKYGPNNAVVALSGDITLAEAKVLMEKYFGAIPAGKVNVPAAADVPTLSETKTLRFKDRVPTTEIQRRWAVPGITSDQLAALDLGASVLGGLASSRLDKVLVRDEQLAVSVSADMMPFHRIGLMDITATVKPGVDPARVEKRLDELLAQYLAEGPTADELRRAATQVVAARIRGMERVAGKNVMMAEGQLYNSDSNFYRRQLQAYASVTPGEVQAAMKQWLGRPAVNVIIEPGERPPYVEAAGKPKAAAKADIKVASVKRTQPAAGVAPALDFPTIERTTLANGIKLTYAQRTAVPVTQVALSFDAGAAADRAGQRGLQNMVMSLLDEGTATRSAQAIAEEKERLGASLSASGGSDRSLVTLSALSANLAPSLALMADVVRHPAFAQADVERLRGQLMTAVKQAKSSPNSMAQREYFRQMFGAAHPYGSTALGDEEAIKAFTVADLRGFTDAWLRPDNAELFVVSDRPLSEVAAAFNSVMGDWAAPATAKGSKDFAVATPAPASGPRIVLIDRPDSPQSVIYGGLVTPVDPKTDLTAMSASSDVLGGSTFSRIFLDLREAKGWAYSPGAYPVIREKAVPYLINASVQADRTGDSIASLMDIMKGAVGSKPITADELKLAVASATGELPGQFETSDAVLGALQSMALFGRSDDYYETMTGRYRALTTGDLDAALKRMIDPRQLTFVVVGDAAKVKPQLAKLGYPIEQVVAR